MNFGVLGSKLKALIPFASPINGDNNGERLGGSGKSFWFFWFVTGAEF